MAQLPASGILVEAEEFDDYGGWVLDSQFELEMGSPYLIAHGNGQPVEDATTTISVADPGVYNVWVRAKDWVPGYHPGRFTLTVNGTILQTVLGANDKGWVWQHTGKVELEVGNTNLTLHDLTGFCGRCDAIFLSRDNISPPEGTNEVGRAWRRRLRGLPSTPVAAGHFDVVVVGGGVPGIAAALTTARLGSRVALVHDRPFLGGNASVEIGLSPRGTRGQLVDDIVDRVPGGDLPATQLFEAEANAEVFLEYRVYAVVTTNSKIVSVDAREARSGREIRISAPVFIDCSGKCILGLYSGAETMSGQESRAEYGEPLAPEHREESHHGNTLFFRTRMADVPVPFPSVTWATAVAKDYADLGGQLRRPGVENGPGPALSSAKMASKREMRKRMTMPLTHYWEYGQFLDPYEHGEHIRDHLLQAVYGTFSNVKQGDPQTYANLVFDHVAYVAAQGEFRRYRGAHILTETDIRSHRHFPDTVAQNDGAFCLHYPGHEKYDFRLKDWEWDERDGKPYEIPFRSLYSINISNLMMAGKHMSATHVASSNTKFMGNGAQHAIATAAAAHLCLKYTTTPRGIYERHMQELQGIISKLTGHDFGGLRSRL